MPRFANESIEEAPERVSSTAAQLVVSGVVVPSALGLGGLAIFGLLLISPGCGEPT
jgi:hypothetical protein